MDRAICKTPQKFQLVFLLLLLFVNIPSSFAQQKTYWNPLIVFYGYTPIPDFTKWGKHRVTADPVIVNYKNDDIYFQRNNGLLVEPSYYFSIEAINKNVVSEKTKIIKVE